MILRTHHSRIACLTGDISIASLTEMPGAPQITGPLYRAKAGLSPAPLLNARKAEYPLDRRRRVRPAATRSSRWMKRDRERSRFEPTTRPRPEVHPLQRRLSTRSVVLKDNGGEELEAVGSASHLFIRRERARYNNAFQRTPSGATFPLMGAAASARMAPLNLAVICTLSFSNNGSEHNSKGRDC